MMNECKEYVERIKEEIVAVYEGRAKNDEGETASFWDYFEDALDFEYTVNSRREYMGVKVWVTLGGPNVWIDTRRGEIEIAWGCDRESAWLPNEICNEIDAVFSEYYYC